MITLSAPFTAQANAKQSGWGELYDIYLSSAIVTPWGTTNILRLTNLQIAQPDGTVGFKFFTPKVSPESTGTQGNAQMYYFWPVKRQTVKSDSKFANDKMVIMASNVTEDFAQMVNAISWYDVPIMIRKVFTTAVGATADDCAVLWTGLVDSAKEDEENWNFECSNDMTNLNTIAPRENMHALCRFQFGDDLCTQHLYIAANYKSKTVGNASSTTIVKSADFTEDTGLSSGYGTDLVNALADAAIVTSSQVGGWVNQAVIADPTSDSFTLANHNFTTFDPIQFSATLMPSPLVAGTTYYAIPINANKFYISASSTSLNAINFTTAGTSVKVTSVSTSWAGHDVKASSSSFWKLGNVADWGTETEGFFLIPDAQSGLANGALKPWVRFDFGAAVQPKVWQVASIAGARLEELVRMIVFFSSTDDATWKHEGYYELPPFGGITYDVLLPNASNARYWRICIRTRWAVSVYLGLLSKVSAFSGSRHYWRSGRITFDSNTATVALRGVSRRVLESYSGQITVPVLPAAPANGDTFKIQRGCSRTFNDCCSRYNWENFGGFLDLPFQAVAR